jgi:hypothetical protein
MSGENVDIIRRLIPANKKSQEECLPYLAPDLEIIPMDHFPDRTIFRGPSGWERWSTRWTSMFDEHELTIARTWEAGDQVVVELCERVRSAGSSFPLETNTPTSGRFETASLRGSRSSVTSRTRSLRLELASSPRASAFVRLRASGLGDPGARSRTGSGSRR